MRDWQEGAFIAVMLLLTLMVLVLIVTGEVQFVRGCVK